MKNALPTTASTDSLTSVQTTASSAAAMSEPCCPDLESATRHATPTAPSPQPPPPPTHLPTADTFGFPTTWWQLPMSPSAASSSSFSPFASLSASSPWLRFTHQSVLKQAASEWFWSTYDGRLRRRPNGLLLQATLKDGKNTGTSSLGGASMTKKKRAGKQATTPSRASPWRIRRRTNHIFKTRKEVEQLPEEAEHLIPVRLDLELDDRTRLQDTFVWNFKDPLVTPELFAEILCEDVGVLTPAGSESNSTSANTGVDAQTGAGKALVALVARSIRTQVEEGYRLMESIRDVPQVGQIPILLEFQIGSTLYQDRLLWDISADNDMTPEQVAHQICCDLGLAGEYPALLAHSIREQIHRHLVEFSAVDYAMECPVRRPRRALMSLQQSAISAHHAALQKAAAVARTEMDVDASHDSLVSGGSSNTSAVAHASSTNVSVLTRRPPPPITHLLSDPLWQTAELEFQRHEAHVCSLNGDQLEQAWKLKEREWRRLRRETCRGGGEGDVSTIRWR